MITGMTNDGIETYKTVEPKTYPEGASGYAGTTGISMPKPDENLIWRSIPPRNCTLLIEGGEVVIKPDGDRDPIHLTKKLDEFDNFQKYVMYQMESLERYENYLAERMNETLGVITLLVKKHKKLKNKVKKLKKKK